MNYPALIFRLLSTAWRRDTADEALEGLSADVAARVGAAGGFACVALVPASELARLYPLARLLAPYGLSLYCRHRDHDDCAYIFAQLEDYPGAEASRAALPATPATLWERAA